MEISRTSATYKWLWCTHNHLQLCVDQCLSFSRAREPSRYSYNIDGIRIETVKHIRDLGIILHTKLTFIQQAEEITNRANQLLGLVLRLVRDFRDPMCETAVYCRIVRSVIKYAQVVCKPSSQRLSDHIESIKRRLTRYALRLLPWQPGSQYSSYEARLKLVGLKKNQWQASYSAANFFFWRSRLSIPNPTTGHLCSNGRRPATSAIYNMYNILYL